MKFRKVSDGYLVCLEKGEEVIGTLTQFVKDQKIPAGYLSGMGAVTNATIGLFDSEAGEYHRKTYSQDLEVGSMTANISYLENGEPFVHCHIVVSDISLRAFTGHLFEATVSVTLEIYIRVFKEKIMRIEEPGTGFKFWQL